MEIFPDAQGQVTPQSVIGSGQISNSCKTLWLSSLFVKMNSIKNEGVMNGPRINVNFSDAQGQIIP